MSVAASLCIFGTQNYRCQLCTQNSVRKLPRTYLAKGQKFHRNWRYQLSRV